MKAYLKNEISGTDFIELQKGKYNNLHFKEDSIYFCEEDFIVFELIFSKFNSDYRPFRYSNFNKRMIAIILEELGIFLNKLHETDDIINVLKDMKYNIDDLSSLDIHEISSLNIDELSSTVKTLSYWLNEVLQKERFFSVLGL